MKRILTALSAVALSSILGAALLPSNVGAQRDTTISGDSADPQAVALRRLRAASRTPVDISFTNGFPRSVSARVAVEGANAVERARNFLSQYRDLYAQASPNLALKVRRVDAAPEEEVLFYQTFRGVEVFGAELLVSLDGGQVYFTGGGLLTDTILETAPTISEDQAKAIVRKALERPEGRLLAATKLMVMDLSLFSSEMKSDPHLAWQVVKTLEEPPGRTVFCLLCESKAQMLETIQSRSFEIRLRPLDGDQEEEKHDFREILLSMSSGLGAWEQSFDKCQTMPREELKKYFDAFMEYLRKRIESQAEALPGGQEAIPAWLEALDKVYECKDALNANANQKLTLSRLTMQLGKILPRQASTV